MKFGIELAALGLIFKCKLCHMKQSITILAGAFIWVVLGSCTSMMTLQNRILTTPVHTVFPQRMLLLNTVDVSKQNYRDNKDQLFILLIDKTLLDLEREIKDRKVIESEILKGLTPVGNTRAQRDSVVLSLMNDKGSTDAIVISSYEVFFEQREVVVTENDDGSKDREALYDLISRIRYLWYNREGLYKDELIEVVRFHSSRSVLSGLLAAGPNIVKQQDDAFSITEENVVRYLNLFLPGYEYRTRPIFTSGEFSSLQTVLNAQDYEGALEICERLTNNPKRKIAGQANYNCAVLNEQLRQYSKVRPYLEEASRLYVHLNIEEMLHDY
jgi:hypothetical protein